MTTTIGAARTIDELDFPVLVERLRQAGYADNDIESAEHLQEPESASDFALALIYVICNSGIKFTVARRIYRCLEAALDLGHSAATVFGHKGKSQAIDFLWAKRQELYEAYLSAEDKLQFLEDLPWIGKVTKFHAAKNFGLQVSKPDVHLERLGRVYEMTPQTLCELLAERTGYKVSTIDTLLWRASATGILDSHTGIVNQASSDIRSDDSIAKGTFTDNVGIKSVLRSGLLFPQQSGADFSPCGKYRYRLWRFWNSGPICNFLLLNPSTADDIDNDPTVVRCIRRARLWSFAGVIVTNLFAFRSTVRIGLRKVEDPVGPENDSAIANAAKEASMVVCAWGLDGARLNRAAAVLELLRRSGCTLHTLKLSKDGVPVHPLYLSYTLKPVAWIRSRTDQIEDRSAGAAEQD